MPIDFDGIDDLFQVANESNFDFEKDDACSIGIWIFRTSVTKFILAKQDPGNSSQGYALLLSTGASTSGIRGALRHSSSRGILRDYETSIPINEWHHVGFTYDGSGNASGMTIYIDGVPETSNIIRDNFQGGDSILNNVPFQIGAGPSVSFPFAGGLGECFFYDIELSAAEWLAIVKPKMKNMPQQVRPADLVEFWPMNDGENGTSADGDTIRGVNGNDGTGDNGANNTGLTWRAEEVLSYPGSVIPVIFTPVAVVGNPWYYYAQQKRAMLCG